MADTTMTDRSVARSLLNIAMGVVGWILTTSVMLAQETKKLDVDIDINSGDGGPVWYTAWWVWVLIAVFLIVVIALTTRGRRAT